MMYVQSCFAYEAFFLEGHERFSIWPHFKSANFWNSKMA